MTEKFKPIFDLQIFFRKIVKRENKTKFWPSRITRTLQCCEILNGSSDVGLFSLSKSTFRDSEILILGNMMYFFELNFDKKFYHH